MDVTGHPKAEAVAGSDQQQEHAAFDAPPPETGRLDAFISYARRPVDREFVDWLANALTERGKSVWVTALRSHRVPIGGSGSSGGLRPRPL